MNIFCLHYLSIMCLFVAVEEFATCFIESDSPETVTGLGISLASPHCSRSETNPV